MPIFRLKLGQSWSRPTDYIILCASSTPASSSISSQPKKKVTSTSSLTGTQVHPPSPRPLCRHHPQLDLRTHILLIAHQEIPTHQVSQTWGRCCCAFPQRRPSACKRARISLQGETIWFQPYGGFHYDPPSPPRRSVSPPYWRHAL